MSRVSLPNIEAISLHILFDGIFKVKACVGNGTNPFFDAPWVNFIFVDCVTFPE